MNLIELVLVMVLVGILAAAVSLPATMGADLWNRAQFRDDVVAQGRLAMERMVRELTWIRSGRHVFAATSSKLEFESGSLGNERVTFEYVPASGLLKRTVGTDSDTLVGNVTSFSFTYYDAWNQTLPIPPATSVRVNISPTDLRETDIWLIGVQMTLSSGPQSVTLQTMVYPRSFQRDQK